MTLNVLPSAGYERDAYRQALASYIRREAARRGVDLIVHGDAVLRRRHGLRMRPARKVAPSGHVHTVFTPLTRRASRAHHYRADSAAHDSDAPSIDRRELVQRERRDDSAPRPLTPAQLAQRTMPERWSADSVDALAAIVAGASPRDALRELSDRAAQSMALPSNAARKVRLADRGSGSRSGNVTVTRMDGTYVRTTTAGSGKAAPRTLHGEPTERERERAAQRETERAEREARRADGTLRAMARSDAQRDVARAMATHAERWE